MKTGRGFEVYLLVELPIEEHRLDIHLVDFHVIFGSED